MPRDEAANQRVRDEQRARIMEGALTVFARRGLAATMAEVAAAAGVSQGLAYRYFAGKEDLFRAIVAESMQRRDPVVPDAPRPRVYELLTRMLEARRHHPEVFQIIFHVLSDAGTPPDLTGSMRRRGEEFVSLLRRLIVEGQAAGEVAAGDPDQLAAAMMAYLDGVTRFVVDHPELREHFPDPQIPLRMLRP